MVTCERKHAVTSHGLISRRFSQAEIAAAADELVEDPSGYFHRCREQRAAEARIEVQRVLDAAGKRRLTPAAGRTWLAVRQRVARWLARR